MQTKSFRARQSNNVSRFDIGILHLIAVLNIGQRADAVAQHHRQFIILRVAGFLHFLRQFFLNPGVFTFKKINRVTHQPPVVFRRYFANAGRRTALNLIHQARTVTVFENAVAASAEQKRLLHGIQRGINRQHTGKRPEIFAFVMTLAPILAQTGKLRLHVNHQMRKGFVVFKQNIVTRFKLLNQLIFHQQRLGFVFNDDKFHPPDFRNHPLQTYRQFFNMRIGDDSLLDVFGLAHVQNLVALAEHPVHAGFFGGDFNVLQQNR